MPVPTESSGILQATPVPAFKDNYIWLIHGLHDPTRVAAVDPGDAEPVLAALEAQSLTLDTILVTHHHRDHTGGVGRLKDRFAVPVIGPAGETIPELTRSVAGSQRVALAELGLEFRVLDIPGHTRGHIAFVGAGAVFCGDTLFSAGCGRLFEGTPGQMLRSLNLLRELPGETRVHCGHEYTLNNLRFARTVEPENGEIRRYMETAGALRSSGRPTLPSTMELEIGVNPFLRCREPSVQQAAERHAGRALDDEVAVFAEIRKWKDGFN
jgi:hydroxyacylglutathione hydrolase